MTLTIDEQVDALWRAVLRQRENVLEAALEMTYPWMRHRLIQIETPDGVGGHTWSVACSL